jgi:hypothetical protein
MATHDGRISALRTSFSRYGTFPQRHQSNGRRSPDMSRNRQPRKRRYANGAHAAIPTSPQLANIRLGKSGRLAVTNQFLG